MRCPRDGEPLVDGDVAPLPHLTCPSCNGLFFSAEHLLRLPYYLDSGNLHLKRDLSRSELHVSAGDVDCSCSNGPRMEVVAIRGVEIDRCPECASVWLDHGELRKLWKSADGGDLLSNAPHQGAGGLVALLGDVVLFFTI